MTASTKRLPENSSRSSTHASMVPKIALTTTTISEQAIVSSNAARASGAESVSQSPSSPSPCAVQISAEMGSRMITPP